MAVLSDVLTKKLVWHTSSTALSIQSRLSEFRSERCIETFPGRRDCVTARSCSVCHAAQTSAEREREREREQERERERERERARASRPPHTDEIMWLW